MVNAPGQERVHLPAEQISPALQAPAQVPQFLWSVCRLTQLPLQLVSPV